MASNGSLAGVLANEAPSNLVAHWKMDETSGTTLHDVTPFNNDATTVANPALVLDYWEMRCNSMAQPSMQLPQIALP